MKKILNFMLGILILLDYCILAIVFILVAFIDFYICPIITKNYSPIIKWIFGERCFEMFLKAINSRTTHSNQLFGMILFKKLAIPVNAMVGMVLGICLVL